MARSNYRQDDACCANTSAREVGASIRAAMDAGQSGYDAEGTLALARQPARHGEEQCPRQVDHKQQAPRYERASVGRRRVLRTRGLSGKDPHLR